MLIEQSTEKFKKNSYSNSRREHIYVVKFDLVPFGS